MLRKYRNALLNLIKEAGLDPKGFNPIEEQVDSYQAFRLRVGDSPLYFVVRTRYGGDERQFDYKYSRYTRSHPLPTYSESYFSSWSNFSSIEEAFKEWLENFASKYFVDQIEEIEDQTIPDLWAELDVPSLSAIGSQDLENTPFSSEEQVRIADSLNKFEKEIQSREFLTEEQVNYLHERIEYLVESSKRLGRKDWLNGAIGALIGYAFQTALTTDSATQIIRLGWEAIKWVAHNPPLLP